MKLINITVPTRGNITPFEIQRAIANREEYLSGFAQDLPEIQHKLRVTPIKSNAGVYSFFRSIMP